LRFCRKFQVALTCSLPRNSFEQAGSFYIVLFDKTLEESAAGLVAACASREVDTSFSRNTSAFSGDRSLFLEAFLSLSACRVKRKSQYPAAYLSVMRSLMESLQR
jgi:hypothetical protein